jgi:predicted transcriptional regulator
MTRRTYHLPPSIDQALARHASKLGATPSAIVREALSTYLAIDGGEHGISIAIDAIRQEQHACLLMMKELLARLPLGDKRVEVTPLSDRVRARFDQITQQEQHHGIGNR